MTTPVAQREMVGWLLNKELTGMWQKAIVA
jgi:hypothetical protein